MRDFSKTRIIATLGPGSSSTEKIRALLRAGADCLRVNFSHGDGPALEPLLHAAREAAGLEGLPIPILADIQGPKLRIGELPPEGVVLREGAPFAITSARVPGDAFRVSAPHPELAGQVRPGTHIFLADGTIELVVEKAGGSDIQTRVLTGGRLFSHKGLNLPGLALNFLSTLTPKDRKDLEFIARAGFDMVAVSFVRSAADIREARRLLGGAKIPVMAKIERPEAIEKLAEILEASDGIMLARGDLGVEMALERLPVLQKDILAQAAQRGKWVIVATQMLLTMVSSPRPTRAEVSDVANAILDGADAVMLSEETATGNYAPEAVAFMAKIAREIEAADSERILRPRSENAGFAGSAAGAAVLAAERLGAKAIVTLAGSGLSALLVSKQRPRQPIVALSAHPGTLRRLNVLWGVYPVEIAEKAPAEEQMRMADQFLLKEGWAKKDEPIVVVAALPLGQGRETNTIRFHRIGSQV